MKRWLIGILVTCLAWGTGDMQAQKFSGSSEYVILTSRRVGNDLAWRDVVDALNKKHKNSVVLYYNNAPREALPQLRNCYPRYVAVVEKPEVIDRDFIVDLNRMSREVDSDIYADFLCGVITGYTADDAMKMVTETKEPLEILSTLSTVSSFGNGDWFDRFAFISDSNPGEIGSREVGQKELVKSMVTDSVDNVIFREMVEKMRQQGRRMPVDFTVKRLNLLQPFYDYYAKFDPDMLVTAAHATENNLEMPYSGGNLRCKDGNLYADFPTGAQDLVESGKRRIYLPIGNCLMGNLDKRRDCMALAFMHSAHVRTLIGYTVETWYGRNGWGGLCYWMNNPGRYTLAEAFYLNQQDMVFQLRKMMPELVTRQYPFVEAQSGADHLEAEYKKVQEMVGKSIPQDAFGLFHDRDVVAFYGDPKWDVRLKKQKNPNDYEVKVKIRGDRGYVIIETGKNFSLDRLEGSDFTSQHVGKLPFSYFFPKRLINPRLAEGQDWEAAVDENFLLIYNPNFEPEKTYTIELLVDKQQYKIR